MRPFSIKIQNIEKILAFLNEPPLRMIEFPGLLETLGEDWLKSELEKINKKEWVLTPVFVSNEAPRSLLKWLDGLVTTFKNFDNFDVWCNNVITAKDISDCLFELTAFEDIGKGASLIIFQPENNGKVTEAFVKKAGLEFHVEMTRIKSMANVDNRVNALFKKSRKKFNGYQGIHFVDCSGLADLNPVGNIFEWSDKLCDLVIKIRRRFQDSKHQNKETLAFVLTFTVILWNPDLNIAAPNKVYWVIPKPEEKGGLPKSKFHELFSCEVI